MAAASGLDPDPERGGGSTPLWGTIFRVLDSRTDGYRTSKAALASSNLAEDSNFPRLVSLTDKTFGYEPKDSEFKSLAGFQNSTRLLVE